MDVEIPEIELEHELQRFTSNFIERITQAMQSLEGSSRAEVRDAALRKNLLYASSAIEITTGSSAAVNLLDMFVFMRLTRRVLEGHWIPTLYRDEGVELADAFTMATRELDDIVVRALSPRDIDKLTTIVDSWAGENPRQINVEGVRLSDFSGAAGAATSERALQAKGLLSSVKVATEAANKAMVFADRGMFVFHRLPFLLRLQARMAVREILNDTMVRLKTGSELTAVAQFARRTAYVALLGAATGISVAWFMLRRKSS